MQHGWRSIAHELECDPDDHRQVFDAMATDLVRRWWARDEAELELAEIARGVVRSDSPGPRPQPQLARAVPPEVPAELAGRTRSGPDPAGDDQGIPEHDGGLP